MAHANGIASDEYLCNAKILAFKPETQLNIFDIPIDHVCGQDYEIMH